MAKRGDDLVSGTGVSFTPGQASLSRRQIELEQALRQKQGSGDVMDAFDTRQIRAAATFADKVMDDALGKRASQIDAGDRVVQAYHGNIRKLWDETDKAAKLAEGWSLMPPSTPVAEYAPWHESMSIVNHTAGSPSLHVSKKRGRKPSVT